MVEVRCKSGFGRVVKREYQEYLLRVREEEWQARLRGRHRRSKSLEEIRKEYEEEHGSRFMNI